MKKNLRILLLCAISAFALNFNAFAAAPSLYAIGNLEQIIDSDSWNPSIGLQFTETSTGSGLFTAEITVNTAGRGYFFLTYYLGTNSGDWDTPNSYRWGPYGSSDVELPESYQYAYGLTQGNGASKPFFFPVGSYRLLVNTNVTPHTMTYMRSDAEFYVLGAIPECGYKQWNPAQEHQFSNNGDGTYSTYIKIATDAYSSGNKASFCITSKTGTWEEVNPHRLGASADQATPSYDSSNNYQYTQYNAWSVAEGVYKIDLDPMGGNFNITRVFIPTSLDYNTVFNTESGYVSEINLKADTQVMAYDASLNYEFTASNFPFTATNSITYSAFDAALTNAENTISIVENTTSPVTLSIKDSSNNELYNCDIFNVTYNTDYETDNVSNVTVRLTENDNKYRMSFINFDKPTFDGKAQVLPATKYDIYRVISGEETFVGSVPYTFDFDNKPTYNYEGGTDSYVYQDVLTDAPETVTYVVKAVYASDVANMEKSSASTQVESIGIATGVDGIATDVCGIYPNPTSGIIHISSPEEITSISVYNLTGALVKQLPAANTADLSDLAPSTYLVKVNAMTPVLVIVK